MHTVKSVAGLTPSARDGGQVANVKRRRWIFDSVVWTASLLFAFGLLMDSALAKDQSVSAPGANCKTERSDAHWQALRNLRK